jgi:hypothetical protein
VPTNPGEQVLSVISDRTFDGVYVPTIAVDDRHLLTLDRDRALLYVAAWAEAIARAEFDAAVLAQLTGIGIDEQMAVAVIVKDLRPDRPPIDTTGTAPLRLEPILSVRTKRGQVAAYLGDEHIIQLDAPTVYDHIAKVLPVVMTCDLDAAYRRFALGQLEQPEWRADAMVDDLGVRWRLPETAGAEHDRWVSEQFAGIAAAATAPTEPPAAPSSAHPRQPWQAKRRGGKPKKRR